MRIIIAGGGVAGLVLASSLDRAEIDYVLLEARGVLDPQVGASIAMNPGSLRVLDQLGAADEIIQRTVPIQRNRSHYKDGSLIAPEDENPRLVGSRFGYETAFMDRQLILRAMANSIRHKERIQLNQRIKSVEHRDDGVTVHCVDGSTFHGDLLVGCDGVNSIVRSEMWRIADKVEPGYFPESEKKKMTAEYSCLFGISNPLPNAREGDIDYTYDEGRSFLVITGKNGRLFWFFFQKLDKVYTWGESDFPRYTQEDAANVVAQNGSRRWHETNTLKDLWEQRVSATLVPMEEALFDKWSWRRLATVGDSAHKMTANHGQAGNNAVESAVSLANHLERLRDDGNITTASIQRTFEQWQARRQTRINATVESAAMFCRMQALATWKDKLLVFWVIPNAASFILDVLQDTIIGADILEYLPVPERSFIGNTAFNPKQGVGYEPNKGQRALFGLPLLAITAWVAANVGSTTIVDALVSNSLRSDTTAWYHGFGFIVDAGLVYAIWLIESVRRNNVLTFTQMVMFFGLASFAKLGIGMVAPVFYFLNYVASDIAGFAALDKRLTAVGYTRTVLPLILALVIVPYTLSQHVTSGQLDWYWTLIPIIIDVSQRVLIRLGISPNTVEQDRLDNVTADLPHIRMCIAVLSLISAGTWLSGLWTGASLVVSNQLLQIHWIATVLSSLAWVLLLIKDLKVAGMIESSWLTILASGVGLSLLTGPTATVAMAWWWREEVLASRRERNAFTREKYLGASVREIQGYLKPSPQDPAEQVNGVMTGVKNTLSNGQGF